MSEQLLVVDLATGEITELTARDLPAQHHQPTWLPDESGLVVTTNVDREFTGIARYDLAGGRPPAGVRPAAAGARLARRR